MIPIEQATSPGSLSLFNFEQLQDDHEALRHAWRQERTRRREAEKLIEALEVEINRLKEVQRLSDKKSAERIRELAITVGQLRQQLDRFQNLAVWLKGDKNNRHILAQRVRELETEVAKLRESKIVAARAFAKKIRDLQQTIRGLTRTLEKARKYIAWLTRQYFGTKSERITEKSAPAEQPVNNVVPITAAEGKRPRGQQRGAGNGHGRSDRSELPPEEEVIDLTDTCCEECGKPFHYLEETEDSEVFEVDVKAHRRVIRRRKAVSQCLCKGRRIITAPVAPKLYPKTQLGNTLWVYLIVWMYMHTVPLNRVLQDLSLRKLHLSHGTVIGGFRYIDQFLDALYRAIVAHCQAEDLWNNDEIGWRVFEGDDGTRNKKKWWFWVFAATDAIVYKLSNTRAKEVPKDFFGGSSGTMTTDRYAAYLGLSDTIENALCWVHVKRDFYNIFVSMPNLKDWAEEWVTMIGQLFSLNNERVALWKADLNWQGAQQALEGHVQQLKELWQIQLPQENLHEQQKKVLSSLKKHWDGLVVFLKDPRIQPSNNRAERFLRPIALQRKNSYGSGKEWSGMFAAKVFTILQTWKVNGLNPEALLLDYFNECAKLTKVRGKPPPVLDLNRFLPWMMDQERKEQFKLPKNIKRPA